MRSPGSGFVNKLFVAIVTRQKQAGIPQPCGSKLNRQYSGRPIYRRRHGPGRKSGPRRVTIRRTTPVMSLSQTRAQTRAHVIALSPKSSRKPKGARSAKGQSNRTHFAVAAVLGVALVLLALSLSHLAAGIALVTGAGALPGESSGSSVTGFRATQI
jgi:hypothetical protein